MALQYFTLVHVLISFVGIAAGFGFLSGLLAGRILPRWTAWFLATTIATSVTGFFFPLNGFTPALATGVISMAALGIACHALYVRRLAGRSREVFVIMAVLALYLNVFVLVVQTFQKFPAVREIAPTQSSPVFGITQGIVLAAFIVLGIAAHKRLREVRPPQA